jgi:hypothetical protein
MTGGSLAKTIFSIPFENPTSHSINIRVKLDVEIVLEMLSNLQAFIIATTLQALLTGVYFALFLLCLRWLIFSDDGGTLRKDVHRSFLIITVILFAFSVTALGLCMQRALFNSQGVSTITVAYIEIANVRHPRIELLMG